jgi:hypothetical protein
MRSALIVINFLPLMCRTAEIAFNFLENQNRETLPFAIAIMTGNNSCNDQH